MPVQDYTENSKDYDAQRYVEPHHRMQEELRTNLMLDLLGLGPQMSVADVATGTGRGALLMAPHVAHVTAIDGTAAMLDLAKAKAADQGITNLEFLNCDAFELELPDAHFDRVMSLNFLHLFLPVKRQAMLVAEMARVLKPGGKLLIELDNGLHGGPLGIIRKYIVQDIGYNWPWHIKPMLKPSGLELETIAGSNIPGLWRLWKMAPNLVQRVEKALHLGPARNIMRRFQVLARKPS